MFKKTRFTTVTVKHNTQGISLGQGACKAVKLHWNRHDINSVGSVNYSAPTDTIYYGDSQQQTVELSPILDEANGEITNPYGSHLSFCEDLSEVFVRGWFDDSTYIAELEVIIYE